MLNQPRDVFIDLIGNLYIVDSSNFLIRKVNAVTNIITNFVGNHIRGFSGDSGLAINASISYAYSVTLDAQQQNLYFSDSYNHRIRKVNLLTNVITTFAGTGSIIYNGENILALNTNCYYPMGINFDQNGNFLYYNDMNNFRIRKINMKTNIVATIAGNGKNGKIGDNIAATSANIGIVFFSTFDAVGNIYFSEYSNHRIRKIDFLNGLDFNIIIS
jgi:sugar lactone lactonase YvrE